MRLLDLFSGIGGFALAGKWIWGDNLDIVGFCEIEKYAQKVLNKNFPDVPIYDDVTKLDGTKLGAIDIITGGFPCQDISIAGKGRGFIDETTGERTRSGLWTELCRIISEVRPRYALIENVPMLIHRGLERVLCDLAEIGYDCEWQVIGADDVGAWHRRKRIWIVAYPQGSGLPERPKQRKEDHFNGTGEFLQREGEGRDEIRSFFERSGENVPYTKRQRGKRRENGVEGFETQRGKTVSRRGNTGKKKKSKKKKRSDTYRNGRDYGRKVAKESNEGFSSGRELERGKSIKFHPDVSNSNGNGLQHSLERQDKVRLSSSTDTQREGRGASNTTGIRLHNKENIKELEKEGRCELLSIEPRNSGTMASNSDSWDVQNGYHEPGVSQKEVRERLSEDVDGHSDNTGRVQGGLKSRLGGMVNGIPSGLDGYWRVEPPIPRVTEKKKHRIPRLKGLGNAIVPQVAAYIMYNIKNAEG